VHRARAGEQADRCNGARRDASSVTWSHGDSGACFPGPREQRCAGDDGQRTRRRGHAEHAARQRLSEDDHPAAIGRAFVQSVASPAVLSAPPRWKPNWSATNASPWQASSAGTNQKWNPPETAAFVPTSPAA
jgi:hypothetical protein